MLYFFILIFYIYFYIFFSMAVLLPIFFSPSFACKPLRLVWGDVHRNEYTIQWERSSCALRLTGTLVLVTKLMILIKHVNKTVHYTVGQVPLFPKSSYIPLVSVETRKKGISGKQKVENTYFVGGVFWWPGMVRYLRLKISRVFDG